MNKERIKDLALAIGFKLKEQPDGSMDLNPYVFSFAEALIAEAIAEEVSKLWQPLTEELLNHLDSTDHKLRDAAGVVVTGHYECCVSGGYPHGFVVNNCWRDARRFKEIHDTQTVSVLVQPGPALKENHAKLFESLKRLS
jgi:hypothetical protein